MPKVSVLMPCYNHEKYVGEAIESVLNQTYKDFELFVVDNGCTDNSYNVIKSFEDPRIKVFQLKKNDIEEAYRIMLRNQKGKYIAMMYSDDIWEKNKLEKQMMILEKNPNILLSSTWSVFTDEDLNVLEWSKEIFFKKNRSRLEWIRYLLENGNCLSAPSMIIDSNLYKNELPLLTGYWQLPDYYLWLLGLKKTNIYVVEEVLVKQRFHNSTENANISFPNEENNIRLLTEMKNIVLQIIENLDDIDFLEMYKDKLINKHASTHLEVLCEKFFILLDYAKDNCFYEENALYFFYKYYSYKENGVYVSSILKDKYNYTYIDFKDVSSTIGLSVFKVKKEKRIDYLLKKIRGLLPEKEKEILINIYEKLNVCITKLQVGCVNIEVLEQIIISLDNILSVWNWLSYMEFEIRKEEIDLCKQLCLLYQKNLNIVDCNELLTNIFRYQKAIEKLVI